jgi:cell division protein ZapA
MAQVNIYINGRNYEIACDDGEEAHVQKLGKYVDDKVSELVAQMGQVGDTRLLVMTALLITDELSDAYTKLESNGAGPVSRADADIGGTAEGIAILAKRIDDIAATLERA